MWQQPDSAFALLQEFAVSPEADSLDVFDGHYFQLLVAELLYKNDYQQSNRRDLRQAVAYFDSLVRKTPDLVFLTARAHYINGVGYYERDSVVEACTEYLKALETMEERFEEKELVGRKARFMSYTYNRLGDLFENQIMAEPAIICYKQALYHCKTEPTSRYGIPVLLYNIGIQFDIAGSKDSADYYYGQALANMPDNDSIHYRDIMATKAVLYYNMGHRTDSAINNLKYVISLASDDSERLTRFLTLGNILFEDQQYDSSKTYLETVFEQQDDVLSKVTAAQNLCNLYQMEGDSVTAQKYATFLSGFTMTEIEKKKDLSKVNEMLQDYLSQKQERQAEEAREKSIRKTVGLIVPIALVVAIVIIIVAKQRGRTLLKKQQEKTDRMLGDKERSHRREMEAMRQTHKMQQAALSGRLRRSHEELRDISNQLEQMLAKNASVESELADDYEVFVDSPICLHIVGLVHEQQFKSKMDYLIYKDNALSRNQLLALRNAAEQNLPRFISNIHKQYPGLTDNDMDYCYLILLGLNEADISALLQKAYTTVCDRCRKISRIVGVAGSLYHTLYNMLSVKPSNC